MDIDFTDQDILFIYGKFLKKIKELERLKSTKGCPYSASEINKNIALYECVTSKIEKVYPRFAEMKQFDF